MYRSFVNSFILVLSRVWPNINKFGKISSNDHLAFNSSISPVICISSVVYLYEEIALHMGQTLYLSTVKLVIV